MKCFFANMMYFEVTQNCIVFTYDFNHFLRGRLCMVTKISLASDLKDPSL